MAILAKILQQIYFFVPTLDRACQMVLAKNFLNGHGFTINKVLPDGITETFIPVSSWPPGYPVIVGLLSFIFHISITNAAIAFDCICISLIIYFSRQILLTINCKPQLVNVYIILIGFFLFDFSELPATDLNALAFYLWSIAITIRIIKNGTLNTRSLVLLMLINSIPLSLKYLYAPLIFIPPIYLAWVGFKMDKNQLKKIGLQFTFVTILLSIGLFTFQRIYTGNSVYLTEATTGFFPANLGSYYYIIISSFTNVVFDYSVLQRFGLTTFGNNYFILWWANVLLTFFLIGWFLYTVFKKRLSTYTLKIHYTVLGTITSVIILLELMYLSLRYQLHLKNEPWTYLQEARYMAFIVVFLQQIFFIYLYDNWRNIRLTALKISGYIIALFLLIEIFHGIYFTIKISDHSKNYFGDETVDARVMKTVRDKIRGVKKEYPERRVYFLSSEDLFNYTASLEGATCFFKDSILLTKETLPNSVILFVKEKNELFNDLPANCNVINTIDKYDLLQCQ
jgi:hypothetical protein